MLERLLLRLAGQLGVHAMAQVADRARESLLEALGRVRRVEPGRERDDAHVEARPHGQLHPAQRRGLAGGVGVEAEVEMAREPAELLQLRLRQRRPHRGNHGVETGLVEREDVRVALDDERPLLLGNGGAGPVEAVDDRALAEHLSLRRVHVLRGNRIVVAEPPRPEAEHAAPGVGQRKDEPAGEVVVPAAVDEAGCDELVLRVALAAGLLRQHGAAGRQAEPELPADLLLQAALGQVRPHRLARVRLPEVALVEARRLLEEGEEPFPTGPAGLVLRRRLLVLERDPVAVGEPLDGLDEVEPLRLLHERDQVAALAAAEAVVELPDRVDGEARRLLLVERAAAAPLGACAPKLRARADDLDHVGGRLYLVDRGLPYDGQASAKRSVMPAT